MRNAVDLQPNSGLNSEPGSQWNSQQQKPKVLFATLMVILACVAFGTVPFFVKSLSQAGVKSEYIPFYRYFISALIFLPWLLRLKGKIKTVLWGLGSGLFLGLGWISYVEALKVVPVSTAGVVYMTYPVFTLLIGWIWLKEKPDKRAVIAAGLIVIAAFVTSSDGQLKTSHLEALLYSFLAPLCFGASINILVSRLNQIPAMARVACIAIGAMSGLLLLIAPSGFQELIPASPKAMYLAAGIAIITATLPQLIYSHFTPQIGSAKAAIAGSVELPTMFVVGWLAFGENISTIQWLSGILIVIAISMTPTSRVKHRVVK